MCINVLHKIQQLQYLSLSCRRTCSGVRQRLPITSGKALSMQARFHPIHRQWLKTQASLISLGSTPGVSHNALTVNRALSFKTTVSDCCQYFSTINSDIHTHTHPLHQPKVQTHPLYPSKTYYINTQVMPDIDVTFNALLSSLKALQATWKAFPTGLKKFHIFQEEMQ